MQTRRLIILDKKREHPISIVQPTDFQVQAGEAIEPEEVLANPDFSLYCFDRERQSALFVECPESADVYGFPFFYQAQYDHATGLVEMPLQAFHQIAYSIPEPEKGLVFIHSTGRCGSTLLSKALSTLPNVHSISEPDDLTQLLLLGGPQGFSHEEIAQLVASSVRWRCKGTHRGPAEFVAIKTRSEVLTLGRQICGTFPTAKHLYLYRDGIAWMNSYYSRYPDDRPMDDPVKNRETEEGWSKILPIIAEYRQEEAPMNPVQVRMLAWVTSMEAYLDLLDAGVSFCAARYEDIVAHPIEILHRLFDYCGFTGVDWSAIETVLGRDSQEGTIFSQGDFRKRNKVMPPDLHQDAAEIVATRPRLLKPDVIVPNTVLPRA